MRRRPPIGARLIALTLLSAAPLAAQDQPVFQFSTVPELADGQPVVPIANLRPRPNLTEVPFYLFVRNPDDEAKGFTVELRGAGGSPVIATAKVPNVAAGGFARVRFAAPVPPAEAPTPTPAAPAEAEAEADAPPPGVEVDRRGRDYELQLHLLNEDGSPFRVDNADVVERFSVGYTNPGDYVQSVNPTLNTTSRRVDLSIPLTVVANSALTPGAPPIVAELTFPPQDGLDPKGFRGGQYKVPLPAIAGARGELSSQSLPVTGLASLLESHVSIDGVPRVYVFRSPADSQTLQRRVNRTVRLIPVAAGEERGSLAVTPDEPLALRVEIDGALPTDRLELRVYPKGVSHDAPSVSRVTALGGVRAERFWVNPAGENGAIAVSSRVGDHLVPLDIRGLRGEHEIRAEILIDGEADPNDVTVARMTIVADDTPPRIVGGIGAPGVVVEEDGTRTGVVSFPARKLRGEPLAVAAEGLDFETDITKAVFFVGKPGDDGALPEVIAEGKLIGVPRLAEDGTKVSLWTAEVPIPAEKGLVDLGVQFTNEVGLTTTVPARIELVDPPPKDTGEEEKKEEEPTTGVIAGIVTLGGLPQAGLTVALTDPDGKPKGIATTDDKGAFKFKQVEPGVYRVSTAKPDSGRGTSGFSDVQVFAGKKTETAVVLSR